MISVRGAVLSVAGLSTPPRSMLQRECHALMPLGRKTVMQVLLDELVAAGVERICVLTTNGAQTLRQLVTTWRDGGLPSGDGGVGICEPPPIVDIEWVSHESAADYGGPLLQAHSFVGNEPFIFASTEAPMCHAGASGSLLRRMINTMQVTGADGVIAVRDINRLDISAQTVVEPVGDPGAVQHFVVASLSTQAFSPDNGRRTGLTSRYILTPLIFDYLEEQSESSEGPHLTTALNRMARDREALWAVRMQSGELCFDLSSFLLYSRAFIHFSLRDPEVGTAVQDYLRSLVAD